MILEKTISQNKNICLEYERKKLKGLLFFSISIIALFMVFSLGFPINIVGVIMLYPCYYWLRIIFYTRNKVIYCDECSKIIIWGLKLKNREYCYQCATELETLFNSKDYINFISLTFKIDKNKNLRNNSNSDSILNP